MSARNYEPMTIEDTCIVHSDFWGSPAEANGNMVAVLIRDVLHVMLPETLQGGLSRDQFLHDIGDVKFVQAAFAEQGDRALTISFEDGSDCPYSIGFVGHQVLLLGSSEMRSGQIGWIQFHFGPECFDRIVEYRMILWKVRELPLGIPLPEAPPIDFGNEKISSANRIRIELFIQSFFERCGNDCYDFQEFLAEFYRIFKKEWEVLKHHLVEPWNSGAAKVGRKFLAVSKEKAERLVSMPRIDLSDFM